MKARRKLRGIIICDLFVLAAIGCSAAATLYYLEAERRLYLMVALGVIALVFLIVEAVGLVKCFSPEPEQVPKTATARAITLLGETGESIRYWDITQQFGYVIGRSTEEADVDIDLSDTEFFSFVGAQHATLNYTENGWFLDDMGSRNGTHILRAGNADKMTITPGAPVPIGPGDTIYIAQETRLGVV